MVSRSKKHKNARARAARQRKREYERMKAWQEKQAKWEKKDRFNFYLLLIVFIAAIITIAYLLTKTFI